MHNYTAFVYGGIKVPSGDALKDGSEAARQCLEKLKSVGDAEQFPPKLLILLVSPAYSEAQAARLVAGIRETFEKAGHAGIKLIGSSVAAVFFEHAIHDNGILLVCLASRLLEANVGVGRDASRKPNDAVKSLLHDLRLDDQRKDLNPLSNRMLLTFFPNILSGRNGSTAYASDELHKLLWDSTLCRIPIAGGVSSGYRRYGGGQQGLQFCGWDVYTDAIVAAQVDSGTPLGVSLCRGLAPLRDDENGIVRLRVKSLSKDGNYIEELEDSHGAAWEKEDYLLLSEDTNERDFIIATPDQPNSSRFRITDKVTERDWLQVRQPSPEMLLDMASDIVEQANKRVHVNYPLACLSLICSSYFHNSKKMDLDITEAITNIELKYQTCVGGFVDGEAGVDHTGRSQFGNWSMVGIGFGDEMRDRTPLHRGFKALSEYSPLLTETTTLGDAIRASLRLIFETGFPGAMISFVFLDQSQQYLVGMDAVGERLSKIVGGMRRPLDSKDALSNVIESQKACFIQDTRDEPDCDPAEKAVLVSQYIIPLRGPGNDIIAVLQIDLGNTADLSPSQGEVLDTLGAAVGSGINRILNWEVVEVTRKLDEAMKKSLTKETLIEGLQSFIEAATGIFGASMGHVRLARPEDRRLILAAGVGTYYEAAKMCRPEIDFDNISPTCEAYSSGKITIVNDARNNSTHRQLIRNCQGSSVEGPLRTVGSYANTPFRGESTESMGTISLVSDKTWFFTWQHQHSLEALGERVGFLVEHLEQKEKKAEANRSLDFLLHASPQLNRVQDFDDMPVALHEATKRFREAAQAHVASLYIWDKQTDAFILRAESGWIDSAWLNAARYKEGEGWIGELGIDILHAPELSGEEEHYARQMFGDEFCEGRAISAIALPLVVRDKSLGILTLYRMDTPGNAGGFTKVGFLELQESADSMAALLSILLSRQEMIFSETMQGYFKKISETFLRDEDLQVLESALCELIVEMFGAASADFYFYGDATSPISVVGFPSQSELDGLSGREPDELIRKVREGNKHQTVLRKLAGDERTDPGRAATEGHVMRQCIPVFIEQKLSAILDVRWAEEQIRTGWEIVRYSNQQLRVLGTVIGSAYNRYRLTVGKEAERRSKEKERRIKEQKQRGFQAMNMLQLQSEHHLRNLLTALGYVPNVIKVATTEQKRETLALELTKHLKAGHTFVNHLLKVALMCANLDPKHYDLKPLLQEVISKSKETKEAHSIEEVIEGVDAIRVYVDYECVKQAFTNIVDNALDAINKRGGEGELQITAIQDEKGSQVMIICENAGGMMHEVIEEALNGRLEKKGRKCSGVTIASHLINVQGGTFNIESDEETWTRVYVSLPLSQTEEEE
jgi:signal transduction histidine kinase